MRESWDEYWLKQTRLVTARSTCLHRSIDADSIDLLSEVSKLIMTNKNFMKWKFS